jgi:16S rRNA (guanine527-N7)-methyltransferase
MREQDAKDWLQTQFSVSRETWGRLEAYVAILLEEMEQQNLIAESTRPHIWARHIVDSAQLFPLASTAEDGLWIDLGSGAGLPGIVVAILTDRPVQMVESRRKRIDFLNRLVTELGLDRATVFGGRVEMVPTTQAAVISARAYAPLPRLFESALHLSSKKTTWVLPKGRNAQNELEEATRTWQGVFHVERSVTDADSAIIVAHAVKSDRRKAQG